MQPKTAGVEVLGPQYARAAVDALEPRHQFQIFPDGPQQHLVEMGVGVDQAGHEHAPGSIDSFVPGFAHRQGFRFDGGNHSILHPYGAHE